MLASKSQQMPRVVSKDPKAVKLISNKHDIKPEPERAESGVGELSRKE